MNELLWFLYLIEVVSGIEAALGGSALLIGISMMFVGIGLSVEGMSCYANQEHLNKMKGLLLSGVKILVPIVLVLVLLPSKDLLFIILGVGAIEELATLPAVETLTKDAAEIYDLVVPQLKEALGAAKGEAE